MIRQDDKYIVAVTVDDSFYLQSSISAICIVGAYMVLASCCITYTFSKIVKERLEKEKLIYTSNTDELIRAAADCMKNSFNEYGKVYRIGGDEFAVIITEDINEFENMIHRFKSNITNWHGEFVDSMAVSYGWGFSTEGNWDSIYEISKAADERMYESKERFYNESGVNRR